MLALHAAYRHAVERARPLLAAASDLLDLGIRLYVAQVFFAAGLVKLRDFGSTRALFADEYRVPLLPPDAAAALGTASEIVLPVLLALGLFTRAAAAGLFAVNVVAVVAYWHVLHELEPALAQHAYWGVLLLFPLLQGPGRVALDRWIGGGTRPGSAPRPVVSA